MIVRAAVGQDNQQLCTRILFEKLGRGMANGGPETGVILKRDPADSSLDLLGILLLRRALLLLRPPPSN